MCNFDNHFNNNHTPVARTDAAGNFLQVNSTYEKLTGYTFDELQQMTYRDITPEKWLVFENQQVIRELFTQGEVVYDKEYIHKSGKVIPIKAHIFRINTNNETKSGMWGIFRTK